MFTSLPTVSVPENTTFVATLTATDVDTGDVPTFTITGGRRHGARFLINGGNQLAFVAPPDFENPADADLNNIYQVQVTANDGHGGLTVQNLSVTVTNVSDGNVFIDGGGNLVISSSAGQNDAYQPQVQRCQHCTERHQRRAVLFVDWHWQRHEYAVDHASSFTGAVIVNTSDGNDTLTVDTSLVSTGKNITFNGGTGVERWR